MQNQENCYENVWILSGTADGPVLANKLINLNYVVFASVVTQKASKTYSKNPKLHIITGSLNGKDEIINFIKINNIKLVVDATHPFAQIISKNLNIACEEISIPLIIYERKSLPIESNNIHYISGLKKINNNDVKNKNILLAIGSRMLNDTATHYLSCGANIFARILPTKESITKALGSCIKKSNIAILEPSKKIEENLEKKLCDFWQIDYVLCRDSGSYSQKNWVRIVDGTSMKLFLLKRPKLNFKNVNYFCEYDTLIEHIKKKI